MLPDAKQETFKCIVLLFGTHTGADLLKIASGLISDDKIRPGG